MICWISAACGTLFWSRLSARNLTNLYKSFKSFLGRFAQNYKKISFKILRKYFFNFQSPPPCRHPLFSKRGSCWRSWFFYVLNYFFTLFWFANLFESGSLREPLYGLFSNPTLSYGVASTSLLHKVARYTTAAIATESCSLREHIVAHGFLSIFNFPSFQFSIFNFLTFQFLIFNFQLYMSGQ